MDIVEFKKEIELKLQDKSTLVTLLETTFKGLKPETAKRALLEGMIRGFKFDNFLKKDVYAIPFKDGYSLISSIDYSRKVGMRSGVVGKSAPLFDEIDGKIISCTITIKRKVEDYVGEYSATAFFSEYNTGRNLWVSKPRTMLAKVAEMHALRMACPEELSQAYIEEEYEQEKVIQIDNEQQKSDRIKEAKTKLESTKNTEELKIVWSSLTAEIKKDLQITKDNLKAKYENNKISDRGELVGSTEVQNNGDKT